MFTSGSTGEPKAVRQGFAQWMHQITELGRELDIGPGRKVALAMPVSFGGGLDIALAAVGNGATLCVSHPRTDGVGELTASLIEWRPDSLHLTPAAAAGAAGRTWRRRCVRNHRHRMHVRRGDRRR